MKNFIKTIHTFLLNNLHNITLIIGCAAFQVNLIIAIILCIIALAFKLNKTFQHKIIYIIIDNKSEIIGAFHTYEEAILNQQHFYEPDSYSIKSCYL